MYQRSADVFLGLPFNMASTALLTHLLAHDTGRKVGTLRMVVGDAHLYEEHAGVAAKQVKRVHHCHMCKMLLPPTFEVDHIVELCDGGKDEYSNLQALCPNCHALKTRANILRRDKAFKKEFGKRFDLMQTNSFKEFEYKPKQSKYFS